MKSAYEIYNEALIEEEKAVNEMKLSKKDAHEYAFHITVLRNFGRISAYCPDWIYDKYLKELSDKRKYEIKSKYNP